MTSYRLTLLAQEDFRDIILYLEERNPSAAMRLAQKLTRRFEILASTPKIGRIHADFGDDECCFPESPYLVFYHIESNGIVIDRVIHGARDITPDFFISPE